ncbi:MAG: hypothetical protein JW808_09715 [Victivallales bacterium]|nr:hypothetical protein [Victivallales bacterium]
MQARDASACPEYTDYLSRQAFKASWGSRPVRDMNNDCQLEALNTFIIAGDVVAARHCHGEF